jgi:hypothetical protein
VRTARIGILADVQALERDWRYGKNAFGLYIGEILAHAGIAFEWIERTGRILGQDYDVVVAAAVMEDEASLSALWKYMQRGGTLIACGGLNAMAKTLGCVRGQPLHAGYALLPAETGDERPLRFLGASPWVAAAGGSASGANAGAPGAAASVGELRREHPLGEPAGAALLRFRVEHGWLERWAVDIPGTIVALQQGGGPVTEDGVPAPDGTAMLNDGILKAEDALQMDWRWDRKQTETGAWYFAHPYADLWREAIVGQILRAAAVHRGKPLPFVDYWPEGVRQVAMISHDSDRNHDEDAVTTLEALKQAGIRSTWCMMKPGYSPYLYRHIREAGHELALHFNANPNEGGRWDEADFRLQYDWLKEASGETKIVGNKNHFTRFEGWGELFAWCEGCGIGSDQTRGPSKSGDVGFLFGTCHPYFPIALSPERNRLYDVLEIGFLTQDIPSMADRSVIAPFLEQTAAVRGVAHFLFHQGRIHSVPEIRDSMLHVVQEAFARGFAFWTGRQIHDWERRRRGWEIVGLDPQGHALIRSDAGAAPEEAVVWRPLLPNEAVEAGDAVETRFGVVCKKIRASFD